MLNLLLLSISFIVVAPKLSFASFGGALLTNGENFSEYAWKILRAMWLKVVA